MDIDEDPEDHHYEDNDNDDSDVEARLYAEIHYSNNIIGDENNLNDSTTNNELASNTIKNLNNLTSNDSLRYKENSNYKQSLSDNVKNLSNNQNDGRLFTNLTKNLENNRNDVFEIPHTSTGGNLNKSSIDIQDKDKFLNSLKRLPTKDNLDDTKKMKTCNTKNHILSTESVSDHVAYSSNSSNINCQADQRITLQNIEDQVVNPYNTHPINSQQKVLPLLSAEFINMLFKTKSKKRKKVNKLGQKKINDFNDIKNSTATSSKTENNNGQKNTVSLQAKEVEDQENNILEKIVKNDILQNNLSETVRNEVEQEKSNDAATIIDISSESSNDSVDDSKYSTTVATDKKLKKKEFKSNDENLDNSTSDSEESIFEVPIPPKPAPPLIELKDSDGENNSINESDNDHLQQSVNQTDTQKSLNTIVNKSDSVYYVSSESDESNNLILNCTEIQKGASSIGDIRKLNNQSSCSKENVIVTNDVNINLDNVTIHNVKNLDSQQNDNDKSLSNKKILNSLNNKQKSKSCSNLKHISEKDYFFQPMTDKMKSFYNDSWGGENFDMEKLKSKMSSNRNKWAILRDDLIFNFSKRKRYFGMVCNRCNKDGHRQNECPEPQKAPICHMCGIVGHYETHCSQKQCLTCGRKQSMFRKTCEHCQKMYCSNCNSRGHLPYFCPDLWRRYHNTINNVNVIPPSNLRNVMKPYHQLYCCNCARRGHDSSDCKKLRWSQHFANPSYVTNYSGQDNEKDLNLNIHNECISNVNDINSFNSPKATHELLSESDRNKCDKTNIRQNFSNDFSTDLNQGIIFNIKSRVIDETQRLKLKNVVVKLKVPENTLNNCDSWKELSKFLNKFASKITSAFLLEIKKEQFQMNLSCIPKYAELITDLIKQYASRKKFERSQMFMSWERRSEKIISRLEEKIEEMNEIDENPLQLYDKTKQLMIELINPENQTTDDLRNQLKIGKWAIHQQKLLMILYKEGSADDSLKKLIKLRKNFEKSVKDIKYKRIKNNQQYYAAHSTVTLKSLFEYLYHYNNVFVPYEPKFMTTFIENYKNNVSLRNKLRNHPMFSTTSNTNVEIPLENHDGKSKSCLENLSTTEISITSQTLLSSATSAQPTSSTTISSENELPSPNNFASFGLNNDNSQNNQTSFIPISEDSPGVMETMGSTNKNEELNKLFKQRPNDLYLDMIKCTDIVRKSKLQTKFNNFINGVKLLLKRAHKLNSPFLQKHINDLEDKLKEEIYIQNKDVKQLRKLVRKEFKRRKDSWR